MEEAGGIVAAAIEAFAKRARERAEARRPPPATPQPARPGVTVLRPAPSGPRPAAPSASLAPASGNPQAPRAPVAPARASHAGPELLAPFELPGVESLRAGAPVALQAAAAGSVRAAVLAALTAPGTLAGGVVLAEVLGPPLSLRPPRTGP